MYEVYVESPEFQAFASQAQTFWNCDMRTGIYYFMPVWLLSYFNQYCG